MDGVSTWERFSETYKNNKVCGWMIHTDVKLSIDEELELFSIFSQVRTRLMALNPERWVLQSYYQLPAFDYFVRNCYVQTSSPYDFISHPYGSGRWMGTNMGSEFAMKIRTLLNNLHLKHRG